jgi:hypothetical protein
MLETVSELSKYWENEINNFPRNEVLKLTDNQPIVPTV